MNRSLVGIGWLLILAVSFRAWGDDDSQKNLKSAEAKKALLEYDKAVAKAREAYDKEADGARRKLLGDLEAAQEKATKPRTWTKRSGSTTSSRTSKTTSHPPRPANSRS